ncbi:glutaredoxin [Lophiostoma macrostomum CBS 122681]|uniref:Glutaredoxin n=1 Tax=Lophiostoma macrostomum CBS 122681 TaxID=1314788 RepID=A0A6A6TQ82_9PLEO|nr:glutaredoxin [Lophiostoma macrostomum CBS 122681]
MPSQRRMRVFALLVVLVVIITLYMTDSAHQTRSSDFYKKTQDLLQSKEYEKAAKQRDADDVDSRLKAAEEAAKKAANDKSQKYFDSVDGGADGKSVAGRVMMNQQDGDSKKMQGVAGVGGRPRDREGQKASKETQEEHEVEVELNAILKKSPIIIFSKTYCPYSKKAKHILLETYKITPPPYVVELDEHPFGPQLQATLGEMTGRKTVPNVLLMGKSIGGGDDIAALHESNTLLDTVKSMGGTRITEASLRGSSSSTSEMRRKRMV